MMYYPPKAIIDSVPLSALRNTKQYVDNDSQPSQGFTEVIPKGKDTTDTRTASDYTDELQACVSSNQEPN